MCQSLEDCLVSRIGFRVFLVVVGSILAAVITINVHYVLFRQPTMAPESAPSPDLNGAVSSAVVRDYGTKIPDPQLYLHNRTKVLIWSDDDGVFFAQLSRQIIYLRTAKRGCSVLNRCAFSSDKRKFDRADAVIVASKNSTSLRNLAQAFDVGSKIWTLLLPDPSYHSAFIETVGSVQKFDSLVSYLPNSTFPLVRIRFEPRTRDAHFSPGPTKSTLLGISQERAELLAQSHRSSHKRHDVGSSLARKHKRETGYGRRVVATILDECHSPGNRESYIDELRKTEPGRPRSCH